jgi:Tol biopolymer transport system component
VSLAQGARLGPYEVVSAIGSGGMGEVFRARDTKLNREVAIKVLPAEFASDAERVARFKREAQVLASLNHPNIAGIHGLEETGADSGTASGRAGIVALVMELVEGEDLSTLIARGAMPLAEALPIARQIAEALEAAHEQGIVHRDLKPGNIKVRADGTVKVLDFGLAKAMDPAGASNPNVSHSPTLTHQSTQAGLIIGTAAYMSPEQAKGKSVDKRADIWAFGVVLYEMLTGKRAFKGEDVSDTLASVLKDTLSMDALPPPTPPRLKRLIERCLERDLKNRLRDIGEARFEISKIEAGALDPSGATAIDAVPAARASRRSRVAPWAVAALFAAAFLIVLALWSPWTVAPAPPLVRLSVDLGPDAVNALRWTVAVSRDGHRIVFPIRGAGGTSQLATRLLDQATVTPLPGTENGESPFFSPDGQWIAFAAEGKLKKVPVGGGAAFALCDAPNLRGGAWGENGTIVAALDSATGLSRISEAGGTPQPLTTLANGDVTHRFPQLLPGGRAVLFTASTNGTAFNDATIAVAALDTGQVRTIVRNGYAGRYVAGHLVYMHQDVLFSMPFDVAGMTVRGTPTPVLDDVAAYEPSGAGQFDFSDTGTFIYRSGKTSDAGIYPVVWLDHEGKTQPLLAKPGKYATPRFSPDGRYLALAMDNGIYTYDIQRDALSRLTLDEARNNYWPLWAPDGKHLAYASLADKTIRWIRSDGGGEPQTLFVGKGVAVPWSFSADGRYLFYSESGPNSGADLWILPLDARDPEHLKPGKPEVFLKTPANEGGPVLSPDGRFVAYSTDESGRFEVVVRPFQRERGGKWQMSTNGGGYSYWSRDGHSLYFVGLDRRTMVVDYTVAGDSLLAGKPRVWSETLVRSTTAGFQPMDLAPDGKRFAALPSSMQAEQKGSVHVTFLLNFFDYLNKKTPGQK